MRKLIVAVFFVLASGVSLGQTEVLKPAYDFSLPREVRTQLAESAAPPEIMAQVLDRAWAEAGDTSEAG